METTELSSKSFKVMTLVRDKSYSFLGAQATIHCSFLLSWKFSSIRRENNVINFSEPIIQSQHLRSFAKKCSYIFMKLTFLFFILKYFAEHLLLFLVRMYAFVISCLILRRVFWRLALRAIWNACFCIQQCSFGLVTAVWDCFPPFPPIILNYFSISCHTDWHV